MKRFHTGSFPTKRETARQSNNKEPCNRWPVVRVFPAGTAGFRFVTKLHSTVVRGASNVPNHQAKPSRASEIFERRSGRCGLVRTTFGGTRAEHDEHKQREHTGSQINRA